ncbi:MAG TPA: prenyltransferase/squalene oxidase repeat-containing protein [Solirubrobacteraceae bacterium]|nr:prenyltransferase/squalene oxidase repeat-containing protein [Solirubrobacteraceae bacterium]
MASVALLACMPLAGTARAAGNASSAASFIESAQTPDGGFYETRGHGSGTAASLWATVALLAAGKNPESEQVNNGSTAADYLAAHLPAYRSLEDLGLLAIVESASGAPVGRYGDPKQQLIADLTLPEIRANPGGAAMGVIGLLALHADAAAAGAARALLADHLSDGGWGTGGSSDSRSTALVLEAVAQAGIATATDPIVRAGVGYLHKAQVNDGSIAISDRTDVSSSGDVAATAFTIQALEALRVAQLRTTTGTRVIAGLTSYQQKTTGGLSPFGAYDTGVAPSVTETAQAYPAFDGVAFPLPYVAPTPTPTKHTTPKGANHASSGAATTGISSSTPSTKAPSAAFRGATASGTLKAKAGRGAARAGTQVTGSVIGASPAPKLTTRAGRAPAKDYSALILALALAAVATLGAVVDLRRPRRSQRSAIAVAVQGISDLLAAARRRRAFAPAAVVAIGALLISIPAVTGMWSRAPRAATMLAAFRSYMTSSRLDRLSDDISVLGAGVTAAGNNGPALEFPHTPDSRAHFDAANPEVASFVTQWRSIHTDFTRLIDPMRGNRANYDAVEGLPSFDLFPWFLVIPGALVFLAGVVALLRPRTWSRTRWVAAAVGIALVLAPLALGMFGTAAKGSQLIDAFSSIETTRTVTKIQNDFGQLAIGQGSLRTELPSGVADRIAPVEVLNRRWIGILGDFTPMLGVMSNNVSNYRAVAGLPTFTAFPWLFAAPGLLALLIALGGAFAAPPIRRRNRRSDPQLEQARSSA